MPKKVPAKKDKNKIPKKEVKKNGLSLSLYDANGKSAGKIGLPKEVFSVKVPPSLLAQAVRVHIINQREGTASTKTRAEVSGGGRKPWRQKGTGRARVGSIRVPHWRGGGVVFGPKPRNFHLKLPDKMRRKALFGALSDKFSQGKILLTASLKTDGKTKKMKTLLKKLPIEDLNKQNILLVLAQADEKTIRSARNLTNMVTLQAEDLNTFEVLAAHWLVMEKEVPKKLSEIFLKGNKEKS